MRFSNLQFALPTFIALACCTAMAQGHPSCNKSTLRGDYAFQITGQIFSPPPAAGMVAGVAMTHFDGNGNMTQVDHVVHNGVSPAEEWRPGSGPYFVNSDCTGYMILTPNPTNPKDGGPPLRVEFVIGNDGNEIRDVVTSSPASPLFAAAIISTATRVYQPED